jgi:3-dehydrosphinganine reductase
MNNFRGKLALITGGSSGIGLALAQKLAAEGCHVGILSRDPQKLQAAAALIRQASSSTENHVTTIQTDVSNYEKLNLAMLDWVSQEGVPDLFVNSVGFGRPGLFENTPVEVFHQMMDTNYFGSIHTTKTILPLMLKRQSGHIVYISSVAGFLGMYGYSSYAPTKFAVKGFVDTLRTEIRGKGVQLTLVFPPDTETPGLEAEKPFQPPVLVAMNESAPPISAEACANHILKGIARNRYIVTPGSDATMIFKLVGLLGGGLMYPVVDMMLDDAARKVARNQAKYTR